MAVHVTRKCAFPQRAKTVLYRSKTAILSSLIFSPLRQETTYPFSHASRQRILLSVQSETVATGLFTQKIFQPVSLSLSLSTDLTTVLFNVPSLVGTTWHAVWRVAHSFKTNFLAGLCFIRIENFEYFSDLSYCGFAQIVSWCNHGSW